MLMENGLKLIIGSSISATVAVLTFMGYGMVNNDTRNTADHVLIRSESIIDDRNTNSSIDDVRNIVVDVRLEQSAQRAILDRIDSKL